MLIRHFLCRHKIWMKSFFEGDIFLQKFYFRISVIIYSTYNTKFRLVKVVPHTKYFCNSLQFSKEYSYIHPIISFLNQLEFTAIYNFALIKSKELSKTRNRKIYDILIFMSLKLRKVQKLQLKPKQLHKYKASIIIIHICNLLLYKIDRNDMFRLLTKR